jgi:sugar/nucleoside kinase (ribokinase family)
MSERDFDVVVIGELNVDLILTGDVTPVFGQVEKLVDDAVLTVGSSAAIFACGTARLGLRTAFIGTCGDDEFGRYLLRELGARGIDTSGILVNPDVKTGLTLHLSRGQDRAMLTYPGSIPLLSEKDIDRRLLAQAHHLHLASYFLLDALRPAVPRLFQEAHAAGLTVSLDTNYDPSEQWQAGIRDALLEVDIFLPNETELRNITERDSVEDALAHLCGSVPLVAVKQGAAGAIACKGDMRLHASSIPAQVVDTTGAGDSFDAGFVYGWLAGWELARTLQFACICGALSTQGQGGTTAQATLTQALDHLITPSAGI